MAPVIIDLTTPEPEPKPEPASNRTAAVTEALAQAVERASETRLRQTVLQLAREQPAAAARLSSLLLYQSGSTWAATTAAAPKTKRALAPRWVMCVNCKEEFNAEDNSDNEACVSHPGEFSTLLWRTHSAYPLSNPVSFGRIRRTGSRLGQRLLGRS